MNQEPATALDFTKFTRDQKLAALLIVLGPESAAEVLRGLGEQEMAGVMTAMAGLPVIDQHLQREILREFSDLAVTATTGVRGGVEFAQSTLEKAIGASQARSFMGRISHGGTARVDHQSTYRKRRQTTFQRAQVRASPGGRINCQFSGSQESVGTVGDIQ